MAALPHQEEKKQTRELFPAEIASDEEKHHPLKKYPDIAHQLAQIRQLQLEGILFEAELKSQALIEYIQHKYPSQSDELLKQYESHPRRHILQSQLNETNRMLEFMTSDQGWTLLKDDQTWQTEWQPSDQSAYESFRITGVGDVPLYNILAVIYEMDLIKTWMPLCKESVTCGQVSMYCKCGLIRTGVFWPIQDRETVLFGYGVDDLKHGKILIYFDSREDHDDAIQIPKCPKGRCRVDVLLGGFYFERLTENTTKITVVWNMDAKINAPASIINWFVGTFAGSLVSQIVNASKFDEESEYYKRIQSNPEVYGVIKEKLAQYKPMSQLKVDDKKQEVEEQKTN
eukprot:49349_1